MIKAIAKYFVRESSFNWKPQASQVAVLTGANFTEWVEKHNISLVEFYSPNCGFCVKLEPKYEKAAKYLSEYDEPVPLAKIDATQEPDLSIKYNITGYPTIYVFRNGRHYEYTGGRETHGIKIKNLLFYKSLIIQFQIST
jgi:protein disulfide-isomerase A4